MLKTTPFIDRAGIVLIVDANKIKIFSIVFTFKKKKQWPNARTKINIFDFSWLM